MPVYWPGNPGRLRHYCSEHCRSRGTLLERLERERADLDENVVLRLMDGDRVDSTQAERMEAALRLSRQVDTGINAAGHYRMGRWGNVVAPKPTALMSITEIARRIGVSQATASRYLRDMAKPVRVPSVAESKAKIRRLYAPVLHRMTLVGWQTDRSA